MPKQIAHFWAGRFGSKPLFDSFFKEVYSEDDDETPISRFAESQAEKWIDHDCLEVGFENSDAPVEAKLAMYSYADKWLHEFQRRLTAHGLNDVNAVAMCMFNDNDPQIASPKSFSGEGFSMQYLGTIEFEYEHPDWFKDILNS
jgi:hypothetical protein